MILYSYRYRKLNDIFYVEKVAIFLASLKLNCKGHVKCFTSDEDALIYFILICKNLILFFLILYSNQWT